MKIFLSLFLVFAQGFQSCAQDSLVRADSVFYPVKHENRWQFMDSTGLVRTDKPNHTLIYPVNSPSGIYYVFLENGKYGMYTQNLKVDMPALFDTIITTDNFLLLKQGSTWINVSPSHEVSLRVEADSIFVDQQHVYYYKDNKTGLSSYYSMICQPKYDRVIPFSAGDEDLFLTYNAGKFGLIGIDGIPFLENSLEIQPAEHGFIRFRDGQDWKYYSISYKHTIDPKGSSIVFYNAADWKIYNAGRTKSVLYLDHGKQVLSGKYDDYFLLENGGIAVRLNGLIGVTDRNGKQLIAPKYEQVEPLGTNFYQYMKNGLWGMMDSHGNEITEPLYNHFLPCGQNQNEKYALKDGKTGLINNSGTLLIPIAYDYIYNHINFNILQSGNRLGMADAKGKILSNCIYSNFHIIEYQKICVFEESGTFTFFSAAGKINPIPCRHYVYGNNVLKCYGDNYIDVYTLAEDGSAEDYHRYPGIQSFTFVNSILDWKLNFTGSSFQSAYLEENQQNGLFGLRNLKKPGMAVESQFETVHGSAVSSEICAGQVKLEKTVYSKIGHVQVQTDEGGKIMYQHAGILEPKVIVNTEVLARHSWTSASIKQFEDMRLNWVQDNRKLSNKEIESRAIYMDNAGDYKRIYFDGKAELCSLKDADLPAIDYFNYMNMMHNFWFTDAHAAKVYMDPKMGVRFTGGHWKVVLTVSYLANSEPKIKFNEKQSFRTFKEPEEGHYLFEESGSGNLQFADEWNDTTRLQKLESFEILEYYRTDAYRVALQSSLRGKIHVSDPAFVFEADNGQTEYADGLIISASGGKSGLRTTGHVTILPNEYAQVRYLGDHRFGLLSDSGWTVADRSGKPVTDLRFTSIGNYSNGLLSFQEAGRSGILDTSGTVVIASAGKATLLGNAFIAIAENGRTFLYNAKGVLVDSIAASEKWTGSDFLLSKDRRGVFQARVIGKGKLISLKTTREPKLIGNYLLVENGSYYTLLSPDGKFTAQRAMLYEQYSNGLIGFMFSRKWQFHNQNGECVHVSGKLKNRIAQHELLLLDDKETAYFIDYTGQVYPADSMLRPEMKKTGQEISGGFELLRPVRDGYVLVKKDNQWGAADKSGKLVIPCIYKELQYSGNNEFRVSVGNKQTFAGSALRLALPAVFDAAFGVSPGLYLVRNGSRFGYLRSDGTWLKEMDK